MMEVSSSIPEFNRCRFTLSFDLSGHELQVVENGFVPRPEEERITQAEKNERINAQLKVKIKLN